MREERETIKDIAGEIDRQKQPRFTDVNTTDL